MVGKCHTQRSSRIHRIQCTVHLVIHKLPTSHKLRTQQAQLILRHLSRPHTKAARTSRRQLLMLTNHMIQVCTMMTRRGLWVPHRTGQEARFRTRRFAIPSSKRFADVVFLPCFLKLNLLRMSDLLFLEFKLWLLKSTLNSNFIMCFQWQQ